VRQQARAQETQTEALFHTYAQFASTTEIDPKPSDEERRTEEQLNEILEKVRYHHKHPDIMSELTLTHSAQPSSSNSPASSTASPPHPP